MTTTDIPTHGPVSPGGRLSRWEALACVTSFFAVLEVTVPTPWAPLVSELLAPFFSDLAPFPALRLSQSLSCHLGEGSENMKQRGHLVSEPGLHFSALGSATMFLMVFLQPCDLEKWLRIGGEIRALEPAARVCPPLRPAPPILGKPPNSPSLGCLSEKRAVAVPFWPASSCR